MNRVAAAIGLAALLLALSGCGGPRSMGGSSTPRPVVWNDGDPLAPVCGPTLFNCKTNYTVHDRTTDSAVLLPITTTRFVPTNADDYEIRANGYDWKGRSISSAYVALPK